MNRGLARNIFLAVVFVLLVAAHWAVQPNQTQRNYHFLPDMVNSIAYEAQAPVPAVGGDIDLDFRPPEGSVARGHEPLPYDPTPTGAALAATELASPTPDDEAASAARGAFVFSTFCVVCHGPQGGGDGPVATLGVPPPPSLLAANSLQMTDGQMYHVITFGQGNMAGYAAQVDRDDRWHVIRHIRQLQREAPQP